MSEQAQLEALLVQRGLISGEQLSRAIAEQHRTGASLMRVLIELGLVQESDLVSTIAAQLGMDFVDLADYPVDPTAVSIISDSLARRYQALPISWDDGVLVVAMADPANVIAIDDIRSMAKARVRTVVATRTPSRRRSTSTTASTATSRG
jgi:type IV pilus assembly protein PilB